MKFLVFLGVFFVYSTGVKCAKILGVFHMPSPSHYMSCSSVMKILAANGHDVTVVAPFVEKNPPKNYRQIHLDGLAEKLAVDGQAYSTLMRRLADVGHDVTIVSGFREENVPKNYRQIVLDGLYEFYTKQQVNFFELKTIPFISPIFFHFFSTNLQEAAFNHTNFKAFMNKKEKFDVVIVEEFQAEAMKYIAHHFNAHLIVYSAVDANDWTNPYQGNPDTPSYHPSNYLTHLTNHMSFFERVENTLFYIYTKLFFNFITFPAQNRLLHRYYPEAPDLKDIAYNVSLVLLNTDLSVHEPVPKVPSMKDIGGFHIKKAKPLPENLQAILDNAKHGVIYFSLGSNVKSKDMPKEKRDFILRKFSKMKETIIWKFEDSELPGKPDNVIISKWLPQNDIFAHKNVKLFISHGGLFSTMEAVYYGLPVMALSVFAEQELNGKRAEANGLARHVPFKKLTEDIFSETLDELLGNPKYKENAKIKSQIMKDKPMDPADSVNYWVEYVIRHKGAPHLRVAALDLEWYQYLLIDVVLFIIAMAVAFVFAVRFLYKRFMKKKATSKEKKN